MGCRRCPAELDPPVQPGSSNSPTTDETSGAPPEPPHYLGNMLRIELDVLCCNSQRMCIVLSCCVIHECSPGNEVSSYCDRC